MRSVVVVSACVTAVAVVLAMLTGCSSSTGPAPDRPPTLAQATRLLTSYAVAVSTRDTKAVDAALDPSSRSAAFARAQRADYANLAHVPLAHWGYSVLGPITDAGSVRAVRARYGVAALPVHVTLDYRLRGIDPVTSSHDQYLVVTSRGGRQYLAGDGGQPALGSTSWDGPWHYGPLAAVRGAQTLVLGPPQESATLRSLATQTDAAIRAVTAVWGPAWSQRVAVLVPTTAAEFTALTGSGIRDVSAAAVTDGIDPVSGRPVGQRLVLNPTQLARLTPVGRAIVLRHEITHLASAADTADITPRWLVEGFADYVGNLGSGQPVRVAASELRAKVAAGAVPTALPTDAAFAGAPAVAYEQAWLACRLIAARAGQAGLLRFYRSVGTALEPRAPALAHAFTAVLGESQRAFTAQWRAYLTKELR